MKAGDDPIRTELERFATVLGTHFNHPIVSRSCAMAMRRLALRRAPLMDLQGRGSMVTGDSGDLGATIGATLARAGCDVAVGYGEIARARIGGAHGGGARPPRLRNPLCQDE